MWATSPSAAALSANSYRYIEEPKNKIPQTYSFYTGPHSHLKLVRYDKELVVESRFLCFEIIDSDVKKVG